MQPNDPNSKKNIAIALAIAAVVIIGIIVVLVVSSNNKKPSPKTEEQTQYYDKGSGQTVSDPEGRVPESYGAPNQELVFLGISKILDYGITFDQLNTLQYAFDQYSKSSGKNLKEISFQVATINHTTTETEQAITNILSFDVKFDRKDTVYKAKVDYSGLSTIRLYLSDSKGKQFYDSGSLTKKSL